MNRILQPFLQHANKLAVTATLTWVTVQFYTDATKIKACLQKAQQLDTQYTSEVWPKMLKLEELRDKLGSRYPSALFIEPVQASQQEVETAWEAMRQSGLFWRSVKTAYDTNEVLYPGQLHPWKLRLKSACELVRIPPSVLGVDEVDAGFFSRRWAGRGREYRILVEPLDIANWYFRHKNVRHGHYVDGILDEVNDDNHKRPGRYIFLQQQEMRVFESDEGYEPNSSLTVGHDFKKLGTQAWDEAGLKTTKS